MPLAQVASGASDRLLLLAYRYIPGDQGMWRRQGGDAGDASSALALLLVLLARLGALWACPAGVLGGSRYARAAGSSPATSTTSSRSCCSGAAGVAILVIAAQSDGCAGAGAGGRWAWASRATRDASASCAGHLMCHMCSKKSNTVGPNNRTPTGVIQIWNYYILYKVGISFRIA